MGKLRFLRLRSVIAILSLLALAACGGGSKAGAPLFPGRINLTPNINTSMVVGTVIGFVASAQTTSGTNLAVPITYASNDTSILNLAPNGAACAGHWDITFSVCTPGGIGVALVTASALGASSVPTYVFVHPPIDNITVTGFLITGVPPQEPCLSQGQSMTVQAHAFSQGVDITSSVGPFTWTANNSSVVALTPLPNTTFNPITNSMYNFPTNEATAKANNPGISYIYASAGGVTSNKFQQPQYTNSQNATSPVLDFFATCAIQNISLEVNAAGSGQTSFVTAKGKGQNIVATVTDIMGNSSLPNTNGNIVLSKIPLTWTSSQPGVFPVATSCSQSCTSNSQSAGSATITASCSPPSCNIGFPIVPATLATPVLVNACTQFFHAEYPLFTGCQQLIPVPVYASPVFITPPAQVTPLSTTGAISALATGQLTAPNVLTGSTGCQSVLPVDCSSSVYYFPTSKGSSGSENPLFVSPNSFLFDLPGDKIFMGSNFGAEIVNPANFGTSSGAATSLGAVTGKILAASVNGAVGIFSDTLHTPNQVYVVNTASASALGAPTALNITAATTAAFSPDGLKAYILGNNGGSLYVYSQLQALLGPIPFTGGPAQSIAFAPNGAFAFIAQSSTGTGKANLSAYANCSTMTTTASANSQAVASLQLPGSPLLMRVLPNLHINGFDSSGFPIPDGVHLLILDSTGFDMITSTISPPPAGTLCPQGLTFVSGNPLNLVQRVELGQGTIQPVNFFPSADGTQLYILNAKSSTILVYDFIAGAVAGGIPLEGDATPLAADISVDTGTIVVDGSDGLLHQVSTSFGGADLLQVSFPNLPNFLNAFCTFTPTAGPCSLNVVLARP